MKKNFINILITVFIGLILYYFMLPPINLHAFSFYVYLILVAIFYLTISIPSLFVSVFTNRRHLHVESKTIKYGFMVILLIIPVILLVNFVLSPIFNSKAYYSRITISESENFTNDIKEVDFSDNVITFKNGESTCLFADKMKKEVKELVGLNK